MVAGVGGASFRAEAVTQEMVAVVVGKTGDDGRRGSRGGGAVVRAGAGAGAGVEVEVAA